MATLFDYLNWRGDLSFEEAGLNEVDSLILSNLSYIHFTPLFKDVKTKAIRLEDLGNAFLNLDPKLQIIREERDLLFLKEIIQTKRFKDCKISYYHEIYDEKSLCQFAALTIELKKGQYFISYRGTDLSLIGWKEDFTLAFKVVDAQNEALKYLSSVSKELPFAKFYLGGHSKGGNLAMYAASHCNKRIFNKIITVYNHDGPGFDESIINAKVYEHLHEKTISYIPHSSIVGLLFEDIGTQKIIDSKNISILQHDPYSWRILGPNFVVKSEIDKSSTFIKNTLKEWLKRVNPKERENFIMAIVDIFTASGAKEVSELIPSIFKNMKEMKAVIDDLDEITKDNISKCFKELFQSIKVQKK